MDTKTCFFHMDGFFMKKVTHKLNWAWGFCKWFSAYYLIFLHFPSTISEMRLNINHVYLSYPHILSEPDTIFVRFMLRTELCCSVFRAKKSGVDDQWCVTGYLSAVRRWLDMCEVQLGARAVFKLVKTFGSLGLRECRWTIKTVSMGQ